MDPLLTAYDAQVRASFARRIPAGWTAEHDGPLVRCLTSRGGFAMLTPDVVELSTSDLAALVRRTVAFYAERHRTFEWKTFDHDQANLPPLLLGSGFVAEDHEALVMGPVAALAAEPVLPTGLSIRQVSERADLERVAAMESEVWGTDWSWLADDLAGRIADPLEPALVYVDEDVDRMVSAAWLVPLAGTEVAGLWGGSTLAEYRGRGIYRALVAHRALEAQRRGCSLLQVDASDDSRPILERLGLRTVGGTTPYRWTPEEDR
ncbi:MAG: hypothetical protein JWO46_2972 [Nocardioidaceae bacterium]|nr:hypothetical protein [Nocardioidaceae bacterium]